MIETTLLYLSCLKPVLVLCFLLCRFFGALSCVRIIMRPYLRCKQHIGSIMLLRSRIFSQIPCFFNALDKIYITQFGINVHKDVHCTIDACLDTSNHEYKINVALFTPTMKHRNSHKISKPFAPNGFRHEMRHTNFALSLCWCTRIHCKEDCISSGAVAFFVHVILYFLLKLVVIQRQRCDSCTRCRVYACSNRHFLINSHLTFSEISQQRTTKWIEANTEEYIVDMKR